MMNDDELRERFRTLARSETDSAPPFHSEEIAMRRSLERRRRERKQLHPLLTPRRLATVTGVSIGIAAVLAVGLAWGTNTGYASGLVVGQNARNQLATNAVDISIQLSNLRTEILQARNAVARATTGAIAESLVTASASRLQHVEEVLYNIESELSVTGKPDTASVVSSAIPMKRALTATCNALVLDR